MAVTTQSIVSRGRPTSSTTWLDQTIKTRSVQKPFTNKRMVLPYRLSTYAATAYARFGTSPEVNVDVQFAGQVMQFTDVHGGLGVMTNRSKLSYNKAYSKLYESMKNSSADLLALVAERRAAYGMVANRFTQILSVAEAANKGNVKRLAKALGTTVSDVKRRHPKDSGFLSTPASTFLEVYWGWMPMLQDCVNALTYLGKPIPMISVSGSSGYMVDFAQQRTSPAFLHQRSTGQWRVKLGATLTVSSALQSELSRLGVSNPLAAMWEVTPYSWLVDWFTSVGDMIESLDDDLLCNVHESFVTRYCKGTEEIMYRENLGAPSERGWDLTRNIVLMNREKISIPKPFFTYELPDVSWRKVAVVASLITLKLKRFKRLSESYL